MSSSAKHNKTDNTGAVRPATANNMGGVKPEPTTPKRHSEVRHKLNRTVTERLALKAQFLRLLTDGTMTQKEAAAACGISQVTAVDWVRNAGGRDKITRDREQAYMQEEVTVNELVAWMGRTGKHAGICNELLEATREYKQLNPAR